MIKIKQRLYDFGYTTHNGLCITKDTIINDKTHIPIVDEENDTIIGVCNISTDDKGIICNGYLLDNIVIDTLLNADIDKNNIVQSCTIRNLSLIKSK